jgi:hypothetical protein
MSKTVATKGGEDTDAFAVILNRRSKTKDLTAGVTSSFVEKAQLAIVGSLAVCAPRDDNLRREESA